MLCGEASLVNLGIDEGRAVTLRCRAWTCELCQPDRHRQLIALAQSGRPSTFITLTVNPARGGTPAERARSLADAWRVVVKRAKKHYAYDEIPYFCVFEATKRGEPHLHILARVRWIDQKWLSAQMQDLIGAPIVDIRQVKSKKHIAFYIAKYVGKAPHHFGTCKRYWTTRNWEVNPYEPEPVKGHWSKVWEIRSTTLEEQESAWEVLGWQCRYEGRMLFGEGHDPPF